MKIAFVFIVSTLILYGGKTERFFLKPSQNQIVGTWHLITGTHIENNDTVVTDYTKNISFIKIINDTHFAF
jgi:multidrug efflux pump subunit AcrB